MNKGILLFGNYPPPFGGVPTHIKYLADYLSERDWDVHVLSFAGKPFGIERHGQYTIYRPTQFSRRARLFAPPTTLVKRLSQFRRLALESPRLFFGLVGIANSVREIVIKHNIQVISAYHVLIAGMASAWVTEELSIPLITTVFGEIYDRPELHKERIKEIQYVLRQSKRVLSCSNYCAKSFEVLGLAPHVETLYYGIDVDKFYPENDGSIIRQRLGIAAHDPVVIFVGRMVREMGLHILLETIPLVLASNINAKFIIVGTTGELTENANHLQTYYKGQVFVIPNVSAEELPLFYSAATLAVAPSINGRACLGLTLAEAMATGKPTIGANVGGTAEVVINNETGMLVPPENPRALAETILSLLSNVNVMEQLGRRGRKRAVQIFDKELANRRMEQMLHEVLT